MQSPVSRQSPVSHCVEAQPLLTLGLLSCVLDRSCKGGLATLTGPWWNPKKLPIQATRSHQGCGVAERSPSRIGFKTGNQTLATGELCYDLACLAVTHFCPKCDAWFRVFGSTVSFDVTIVIILICHSERSSLGRSLHERETA